MKTLIIFILLLIFSTSIVYADYWETLDQNSPFQIEQGYLDEVNDLAETKKGLDKTIFQTLAIPFTAIRSLFTSVNNFLGEFIFVTRLILWFSFIILLQVMVIKVFSFIIKTGLMISTIVSFIANSDDIVEAYQSKISVPLELRKKEGLKKFHKNLYILTEILKYGK